jgi:hypothetical protein
MKWIVTLEMKDDYQEGQEDYIRGLLASGLCGTEIEVAYAEPAISPSAGMYIRSRFSDTNS